MDYATKGLLGIIAAALIFISVQAYQIKNTVCSVRPTVGKFAAVKDVQDPEKKKEMQAELHRNIPIVRVMGGFINADVSGSVDCY